MTKLYEKDLITTSGVMHAEIRRYKSSVTLHVYMIEAKNVRCRFMFKPGHDVVMFGYDNDKHSVKHWDTDKFIAEMLSDEEWPIEIPKLIAEALTNIREGK